MFVTLTNAKAILLVISILLSLIFFGLEIRGAVYMKEAITKIVESKYTTWEKTKSILKLVNDNPSYLYYFFAFIVLILSLFNPFFDAVLLVA